MKYLIDNKLKKYKYDCVISNIFENNTINSNLINKELIKKEQQKYNFKAKKNQYLIIKPCNNNILYDFIILGSGKKEKINENIFIQIIKFSFKLIKENNYKNIIYLLHNIKIKNKNIYWKIKNIIDTLENLNYKFNIFKTYNIEKKQTININFYLNDLNEYKEAKLSIQHGYIISKGIKKSKDLNNMPPNICNSAYIAKLINKQFKDKDNLQLLFLNNKEIEKIGMNAYLSVAKGSKNQSIISIIEYKNTKETNKQPIIIIGKGLTFDSGGISIKPSNLMHEMKYDMSGAAAIYGIMFIINKLKLNLNVTGILACSENMPDSNSTRPGDVIKTLSGKTVEIINTDAEGRLILCDILTFIEKFNPKIVIDIATLTNACKVALGDKFSGLMSNNKKLTKKLIKAGLETRDYIWELPIIKNYNKFLHSNIADLKNCSDKSFAGAITAACFLSNFTKKYKWAHLDIAGTAWNNKGSTGKPIKLITQFLINYSNFLKHK